MALTWLARSVWYAVAQLLAMPVIVGLASGDVSLVPDYLWRAALLAVSVQLVSSGLLRSREHDADLRAAQATGDPEAVAAVVARARAVGDRPHWQRVLAKHPSPAARVAVIGSPELATRVTFVDGLTAGFLAGLTMPLVITIAAALLTGTGETDWSLYVAAYVAGPLLAGSVGLGLCRAALVSRVGGASASPVPVALGVAGGVMAGQASTLASSGIGVAALSPAAWLPLFGLVAAAGTILVAGLGEMLADAAPTFRRARTSWLAALLVTATVFAALLWVGTRLEAPLAVGWDGVRAWLVTELGSWLVITAGAMAAVADAWGLWADRSRRLAPAWLLERGTPQPWPSAGRGALRQALVTGLVAGGVCAGAYALFRGIRRAGRSAHAAEEPSTTCSSTSSARPRAVPPCWRSASASAAAVGACALGKASSPCATMVTGSSSS